MLQKIYSYFSSECGGGPSNIGTYIFLGLIGLAIYIGIIYGPVYYDDYMSSKEIEDALRYDRFRIHVKPSVEDMRDQFVRIAAKWKINLPAQDDEDDMTFLRVDEHNEFFKVEYKYKKEIKHIIGKPQIKWFHHKLIPKSGK